MQIADLTITLDHIAPTVLRRVEVPLEIRLDRLHLTIQAAMGWQNAHLYQFRVGRAAWGLADPEFGMDERPAARMTLARLLEETGKKRIAYIYDFGDDWVHTIRLGTIGDAVPGHLYPRLTDLSGRCPPEDVGGLPGYEAFLDALGDPAHPEHDDLLDWHGGPFDPATPDSDLHRLDVLKLARRWAPKG